MIRLSRAAAMILAFAAPALATAPDPDARLTKLLDGRVAGAPRACISQRAENRSTVIDHVGIAYDVGGTRYVNRFKAECPQLSQTTILITRTPTSQLCSGDIAEIVSRPPASVPLGSCVFDDFIPYTRIK